MQAHSLRDSCRLNRALPCNNKNNRERLPTKALGYPRALFYDGGFMDINNIRNCANYFKDTFLETFYIVVTCNGNGFILIGEQENFPHLMGISKSIYNSNGYRNPRKLYRDILNQNPISNKIIKPNISPTSKMYKKVKNFKHNQEVLLDNSCPIILKYDSNKNNYWLNNVNLLISDLYKGYMLGWIFNTQIPINSSINISKYCISTWIDESDGSEESKEKYMADQDVELIRYVLSFDKNSELIRRKEYKYTKKKKLQILDTCYRNNCNLLLDERNAREYIKLATDNNILCSINNIIHK